MNSKFLLILFLSISVTFQLQSGVVHTHYRDTQICEIFPEDYQYRIFSDLGVCTCIGRYVNDVPCKRYWQDESQIHVNTFSDDYCQFDLEETMYEQNKCIGETSEDFLYEKDGIRGLFEDIHDTAVVFKEYSEENCKGYVIAILHNAEMSRSCYNEHVCNNLEGGTSIQEVCASSVKTGIKTTTKMMYLLFANIVLIVTIIFLIAMIFCVILLRVNRKKISKALPKSFREEDCSGDSSSEEDSS